MPYQYYLEVKYLGYFHLIQLLIFEPKIVYPSNTLKELFKEPLAKTIRKHIFQKYSDELVYVYQIYFYDYFNTLIFLSPLQIGKLEVSSINFRANFSHFKLSKQNMKYYPSKSVGDLYLPNQPYITVQTRMLGSQERRKSYNIFNLCSCGTLNSVAPSPRGNHFFLTSTQAQNIIESSQKGTIKSKTVQIVRKSLKIKNRDKENQHKNGQIGLSRQQTALNSIQTSSNVGKQITSKNAKMHQPLAKQTISNKLPQRIQMCNRRDNVNLLEDISVPSKLFLTKNMSKKNEGPSVQYINSKQNIKREESPVQRLDRVQSSFDLMAKFTNIEEQEKGNEWKSQCIEKPYQIPRLSHKLSELNFKCTQSLKDSQSLRISEVLSQSDVSRQDTHRTFAGGKRIERLLPLSFSKIEGKNTFKERRQ